MGSYNALSKAYRVVAIEESGVVDAEIRDLRSRGARVLEIGRFEIEMPFGELEVKECPTTRTKKSGSD